MPVGGLAGAAVLMGGEAIKKNGPGETIERTASVEIGVDFLEVGTRTAKRPKYVPAAKLLQKLRWFIAMKLKNMERK